jgi:hypothetical protein
MPFYDIFNGDADGICALQQLRLEEPRASVLVTGAKRDIRLLARVSAGAGDELTVLDISLEANARELGRLLSSGARCRYFDHHAPGLVPRHANLKTFIDTAPDVCTSLIVDRYLGGRQRLWAVVGAFGDNLVEAAQQAAGPLELDEGDIARLRALGEGINYNAYGASIEDLHYHPGDLFETLSHYRDPRDFINGEPVLEVLREAMAEDFERAQARPPERERPGCAIYVLPDAAWARRVQGHYINTLAQSSPERAHALLVRREGGYTVSVRAPVARPRGAEVLCSQFESGGGRQGAAGINFLPESEFGRFAAELERAYPG